MSTQAVPPAQPPLPANPGVEAFDTLQAEPARWLPVVAALAAPYSRAPVTAPDAGTVLVGLAGDDCVVKLYPPFLRDHFDYERTALQQVHGRLSLPTPRLLGSGEHQGWPWLVMARLPGNTLDGLWPRLEEPDRLALLRHIGRVAAELHALPVEPMRTVAPAWPAFLQRQRAGCAARQQRTGLPAQLLAQLDSFLTAGPVPEGPDVMLTGEFTPFNLMVEMTAAGPQLVGMIDFGDGLVGPREYDWLGPMCFFAAGHPARLDAFFEGYGIATPRERREELLRLLLLHRYSCLRLQLKVPGWKDAADFAAVARLAWG